MNIASIRSEFLVTLLCESPELGRQLQKSITRFGYPCRWQARVSGLFTQILEEPPHIVVLDVVTCGSAFSEVCTRLHSLSPEMRIVALAPLEQLASLMPLRESLALSALLPSQHEAELLHALDRITQELYFMFENEQLYQELQDLKKQIEDMKTQPAEPEPVPVVAIASQPEPPVLVPDVQLPNELEQFVGDFRALNAEMQSVSDVQELNEIFMRKLSSSLKDRPVIFFKYLPAYSSLLAAQTCALPLEKIRGIGVNLSKEDPLETSELLRNPESMPQLRALLREAFNRPAFRALTVEVLGEVVGIFVVFTETELEKTPFITYWDSYLLHYQNKHLLKRNHDLEIHDPVTELANRKHFAKELEGELARSRRTYLPTSVIVLDIDQFAHYNTLNGPANGNLVLKQLAKILRKTSRSHDVLARLENDQFGLLLPHTDARGAAVKAERLRRIIESTKFHLSDRQPEGRLTISLGVSEFPSLCNDGESLIQTADEAMFLVKTRGGNKVCVASVNQSFKPDFEVSSTPGRQGPQLEQHPDISQNAP